jgi:hypothetical protein
MMRPLVLRLTWCPSSSHRRAGGTLDRRPWGPLILRLFHQLPLDPDNTIIVDVEATRARLLGDSAYGSADMLGWLVGTKSNVKLLV